MTTGFYSTVEETMAKGIPTVSDLGLFILCCILVVSLVLFFFFYFNRVIAHVLVLTVNQYLWRRYGVYIQLDSVRVTLLGARILFKNFRIHCTDASLTVCQGHITLQYWLFQTQKSNSTKDDTKLPCRIVCSVDGLEGFIYNNVFFYQRIKGILGLETDDSTTQRSMDSYGMNGTPNVLDPENQTLSELSWLQRFLPIQLECTTAAIVIGNQQLQSYLVVKTSQASGTIDIGPSRTTMDHCKATVELMLRKPQVSLENNHHYTKGYQHVNSVQHYQRTYGWWKDIYQWIQWALYMGQTTGHTKETEQQEQQQQHQQEEKVTSEQQQQHPTHHKDYAKIETILECSQLALSFYVDIPGPVSNTAPLHGYTGTGPDIGNGGLSPECGARVSLWNAVINYGPWADKQRLSIQDYFVPNPHRNSIPTARLLPGDTRMITSFDLAVDLMTDTRLRVPTREISKDWKYASDVPSFDIDKDGYYTRPYGWIDVKFKEGSSLKTSAPLVISSDGYLATLDIDLKDVDVATSVNFANVVHASGLKVHIDIPFPLVWNEHRVWTLFATAKKPDVFLLRDHVFLLQDLVKDWISIATPVDLLHFVPISYQVQLEASQASAYLCINEHNIINYPNSMDDNAYLDVHVQKVRVDASLPLVTYQPEVLSVKYSAQLDQIHGGLSLKPSHTRSSFMNKEDAEIFSCRTASLQGSHEIYTYLDVLRHIESLTLNLKLQGAMVKLFGSVLRSIMILRDNYVGSSLHFCTIDEYRQRRANPTLHIENRKKELEAKPLSDPFEVSLICQIEDVAALLPENLYECSHYSQLEFQELQLELRNLDIYTDMYITISPLTWTRDCNPNPTTRRSQFKMKNGRDPRNFIYVDGINLHAHRLFGPLPETATYLCQWEFDIGNVKGDIKPSFLLGVASFAQTFIYNLIDEDNTMSSDFLSVVGSSGYPDVIFATGKVRKIEVCLMTQNSATQLQLTEGLQLAFDNLVDEKYNQRISTQLPAISITCLANQEQGEEQQDMTFSWVEVARVELGLDLTIFRHTKEWKKHKMAQQQFIRHQDTLTGRCQHLYGNSVTTQLPSAKSAHDHHVGVSYAPLFRPVHPSKIQDTGDDGIGCSSMSRDTPDIHCQHYYFYSDDDDDDEGDDYSMVSFNEHWPDLPPVFHSSYDDDNDENDSFRTAEFDIENKRLAGLSSSDPLGTSFTKSLDEASLGTPSEGEYEGLETTELLGYTGSAIPPSIPYSGYLNRFAVLRATNRVDRGQPFFHPYVPPPRTTFFPLKATKSDYKQKEDLGECEAHSFAGLEAEEELDAKLSSHQPSDVVVTSVLEATCPVKILVTPILVKVVQELTEVINKEDWDLETMLDSTQIEYVGQLTRYLTDKFICGRFAFWLPSAHLHFIQNVMTPADLPSYSALYDDNSINQGDMLCTVDLFLKDLQLIGGLTFQDYAFRQKQLSVAESNLVLEESRMHLNVGNIGCKVHYVSDYYDNQRQAMFGIPRSRQNVHGPCDSKSDTSSTDSTDATELVVLDLAMDSFCCKWVGAKKPNYLNFGINEMATIIITESVEILLGAAYSWLGFVDDLQRILTRFQSRRSRQMQVLLHELALFSLNSSSSFGAGGGSAPQFLTIPTNMGRSKKNFRNDVGWKLLARMRQCLRGMPLTLREKLQYRLTSGGAIEHIDSSVMYDEVVRAFSAWRSWEINTKDIKNCRLFTKKFNQQRNTLTATDGKKSINDLVHYLKSSTNCGKLKISRFDFCIYEEEPDAYDNHIIVGPLEFTADTAYKLSAFGTDTIDPPGTSEGYLDVIGKLDIGSVEVSVNPTILAFARHMLTVQWVFTNNMKNFPENGVASSPSSLFSATQQQSHPFLNIPLLLSHVDVLAHTLIRIQHIHLGAWAQKLTMKSDMYGIHGSVIFSNPRLSPLADHHHHHHQLSEKDSDTASGKQSSNRTSRKQSSSHSNRIIMNASGGVDCIDIGFFELSTLAPFFWATTANSNTKKPVYNAATRQFSKRIDTKLLAVKISDVKINANVSQSSRPSRKSRASTTTMETSINDSNKPNQLLKIFSGVGTLDVDVPQSLLRLFSFVEEWGSEQGKRYHFMFQNLINEWEEQRKLVTPVSDQSSVGRVGLMSLLSCLDVKLQFLLEKGVVKADLLRSLSVKYSTDDLLVLVDKTKGLNETPVVTYALQLSKQAIQLITSNTQVSSLSSSAFSLPGIHFSGNLMDEHGLLQLQASLSIDFVAMSLDVGMVDSLLTAHSLLENEVNELVEILSYSKKGLKTVNHDNTKKATTILYSVGISLDGLSVKALGPLATVVIESGALVASLTNIDSDVVSPWSLSGCNFSLSLDQNGALDDERTDSKRRNRLAYFIVDFQIQNTPDQQITCYDVIATRVHVMMQPMALGKLVEMYIYYDSELKEKKKIKREEIEQLAINTKRIVESFRSNPMAFNGQGIQKLLQDRQLSLVVENLGVAIPMMDDTAVPGILTAQQQQQQQNRHQAALLFTLSSFGFTTRSMETTTVTSEGISIQVVKRFDQTNEDHFSAGNHPRINQARLPSIVCRIGTRFEMGSQKLGATIETKVNGCQVDVDGSIGDYASRVYGIYSATTDRFSSLFTLYGVSRKKNKVAAVPGDLIYLAIDGTFDCDASTVRLYRKRQSSTDGRRGKSLRRGSTKSHTTLSSDSIHGTTTTIKLPGLSAKFKLQTPINAHFSTTSNLRPRLHIDLLVHESSNIIHPSLVPFIREVAVGVKHTIQQQVDQDTQGPIKLGSSLPSSIGVFGNVDVSILLRLSKSRLDLSCQPASKVICSLSLDKSEFMVNSFVPASGVGRSATGFGALRRISIEIKHHFSPHSCLRATIDQVTLNAAFVPGSTQAKDDLSLTIKIPSVEGEINMRHLQDLLILNYCWFSQPTAQQTLLLNNQHQRRPFQVLCVTSVTLSVDRMIFSADMGPAIGKLMVAPNRLSVNAHLTPSISQGISASLDSVLINSEGRLSGEAKLYHVIIEARVKSQRPSSLATQDTSSPGQLYISANGFAAKFTYEYQHILELVLEPSRLTATVTHGSQYQVKAGINVGQLIANISVKTFPVLIVMQKQLTDLLEKKQDEAEVAFISWIRSYGDDLVEESLPSACHLDSPSYSVTHQQWPNSFVELYVKKAQVIIYPSQFQDGDNLEIHLAQVKAELHQAPKGDEDQGIHRNIVLGVSKAYLLKNVPGQEIMQKRRQLLEDSGVVDQDNSLLGTLRKPPLQQSNTDEQQSTNEMGTFILGLPVSQVSMESTQRRQFVQYISSIDFMDRLEVSLNIGQLKYIQDLIRVIIGHLSRAKKTAESIGNSRTDGMTTSDDETQHDEGDETSSLDSGIGVGDIVTDPERQRQQQRRIPSKCTSTDAEPLIYKTDRVIHFDPQIRQMGDATPPVEWILGIKREWVPELLHANITLSMDQLVHIIWDLYRLV